MLRKCLNINRAKKYGWKPNNNLDDAFKITYQHFFKKRGLMKKLLIVTGGAGFVGSNLIEFLLKKTTYKIISLDNYSQVQKIILKAKELNILMETLKILIKNYLGINQKFKLFFILVNFQEFIKALFK